MNELSKTYEEFISQFPVYNTYKEAKARGFEAHHIVPICTQKGCSRENPEDDRCVRLTAYEHILAHYYLWLENPDNYELAHAFSHMIGQKVNKLTFCEKEFIENLDRLAEAIEKGRKHSEETKKKIGAKHKGKIVSESTREKLREANLGKKASPELRAKLSLSHSKVVHTEEWNRNVAKAKCKKVYKYDLDGNLEEVFESEKEAMKALSLSDPVIRKYLRGAKPRSRKYTLSFNPPM